MATPSFIPFDDENVIAGSGHHRLEILTSLPDVEAVVVPVGGGGLISGVAFAIKSLNPNVKVWRSRQKEQQVWYRVCTIINRRRFL